LAQVFGVLNKPCTNTSVLFNEACHAMQTLSLALLSCIALAAQATNSTGAHNKKEDSYPDSIEHRRLQRFLGLRHNPHHHVVYQDLPALHHAMLNHGMGPMQGNSVRPLQLKRKMLKPFGDESASLKYSVRKSVARGNQAAQGKWDMIKTTRGKMCIDMMVRHGLKFNKKGACEAFMKKECPSGKGICSEWYGIQVKLKAGKSLKEILDEDVHSHASGGAPSPAGAASPSSAHHDEDEDSDDAKHRGSLAWSNRMDEGSKMPEQGFEGKLVAHDNMKTATSDWHSEYGPHSGHQSYEAICEQYPDNSWCKLRGYHNKKTKLELKSASSPFFIMVPVLAAAVSFVCFFCHGGLC